MERELEMLKWMTDKLSKISSYRTKKNVSLVIGEEYCFVGYDSDGKYTLNLYNKDAEVAESICKYLEIPRKE